MNDFYTVELGNLQHQYQDELRQLCDALLGGASWEDVIALRCRVNCLERCIALHQQHAPNAHPFRSLSLGIPR